jgi:integrase
MTRLQGKAAEGIAAEAAIRKKTLFGYSEEWAILYKSRAEKKGLARSTWVEHDGNVKRYIRPVLKAKGWDKRQLNTFTATDIESLIESAKPYREHPRTPQLSESMRKSIRKTLRLLFKDAVAEGVTVKNPMSDVSASWQVEPITSYTPTLFEVEAVAARMSAQRPARRGGGFGEAQEWLGDIIRLLAFSGLRVSELLALRCTDVDFTNSEINVSKKATTSGGRFIEQQGSKTKAGTRGVPLMLGAVDAAKALADRARDLGNPYLCAGSGRPTRRKDAQGNWVTGAPGAVSYGVLAKHFRTALAAAIEAGEVSEAFTLHALRHVFATTHLNAGTPPHIVMGWMGHTSPVVTINTYGGQLKRDRTDEAKEAARRVRIMLDPTHPRY